MMYIFGHILNANEWSLIQHCVVVLWFGSKKLLPLSNIIKVKIYRDISDLKERESAM